VVRLRKTRNHVPPLLVCDHNLYELRRQIFSFRDHPYARFRALCACHYAADILTANRNGGGGCAPSTLPPCFHPHQKHRQTQTDNHRQHCHPYCNLCSHIFAPFRKLPSSTFSCLTQMPSS